MSLYKILEDAVISELEGDDNAAIPETMYFEKDFFTVLRSELVIKGTQKKLPETWKILRLTLAGKTILVKSEDWVDDTIH